MSDSLPFLVETIDYMHFLLPDEFEILLSQLEKRREPRRLVPPSVERQAILHSIGNMTVICMAGAARAIPKGQTAKYCDVLKHFGRFIGRLYAQGIECPPVVLDEIQRVVKDVSIPGRTRRVDTTD